MLALRREMDKTFKAEFDKKICQFVLNRIESKSYQNIHAYLPFPDEINIYPLLQQLLELGKTIVCPKTLPSRQLENRILHSLEDLEEGIMKTLHPRNPDVYNGKIDLILVPGLAYDMQNYRLGYGGGYYDTFISSHPEAFTLGLFYPFQKVNAVPRERHDVSLHEIIELSVK